MKTHMKVRAVKRGGRIYCDVFCGRVGRQLTLAGKLVLDDVEFDQIANAFTAAQNFKFSVEGYRAYPMKTANQLVIEFEES